MPSLLFFRFSFFSFSPPKFFKGIANRQVGIRGGPPIGYYLLRYWLFFSLHLLLLVLPPRGLFKPRIKLQESLSKLIRRGHAFCFHRSLLSLLFYLLGTTQIFSRA
nr:hypothetical membrane protein [uncultured archaeon]